MFPNLEKAEGLWGRSGGGGPGPQHPPVSEDSSLSPAPTEGWGADPLRPWAVCWGSDPGQIRGKPLCGGRPFSPLASVYLLYLCNPKEWKFLLLSLMSSSTSNSPCAL